MLGMFEDIKYTSKTIEFADNDEMFMYTDGVTEAQRSDGKMFGEEKLANILNMCTDLSAENTLNEIKKSVNKFSFNEAQFDNITMLCFKINNEKSITAKAVTSNLHSVIKFVQNCVKDKICSSKTTNELKVIVEEIFVNICNYVYQHSQGTAEISVVAADSSVKITFTDRGTPFNPLKASYPDLTQDISDMKIGSLGIYMVKKLCDNIDYKYEKS